MSTKPKVKNVKARSPAERPKPKKKKVKIRKKTTFTPGPIRVSPGARMGLNFRGPVATASQVGNTQLVVGTEIDLGQLDIATATFYTRLLQMGATMKQDDGVPQYDLFAAGLSYLVNRGILYSMNSDMALNKLPQIYEVIFNLLRAKTCFFSNGRIQYSALMDASHELPWTITTDVGTKYTFTPVVSSANTGTMLNGPITPSQEGYSALMASLQSSVGYGMKLVDLDEKKRGGYYTDPSAFARSYVYFGSGGSKAAGMYADAELEVPFKYPLFSRFVPYNVDDKVVARVFTPTSGSLGTPVGLSITDGEFNQFMLKNPITPIYKCLDLIEFAEIVANWLARVFTSSSGVANQAAPGNASVTPHTLGFTIYEFIFMIRQTVLSVFPEQCHSQFVAPIKATPSANNSVFQPLIVDTFGTPDIQGSAMLLPTFLVENLSMLRQVIVPLDSTKKSKQYGTKPKKLFHSAIPVWGVYSGDTIAEPTWTDSDNNQVPLFTPGVSPASYADCISAFSSTDKFNPNPWMRYHVSEWNLVVAGMGAAVTQVGPVTVDVNAERSLLHYTRVLSTSTLEKKPKGVGGEGYPESITKYIKNFYPTEVKREVKREKSTGYKVELIPPASSAQRITRSITGYGVFLTDTMPALHNLFIPSIRFDPEASDILVDSNYRVYTGEVSCVTTNAIEESVPVEAVRLKALGDNLVVNLLSNGKNAGNSLTSALQYVADHGLGSDFLKMLLGGAASLIPVVGPAISAAITAQ